MKRTLLFLTAAVAMLACGSCAEKKAIAGHIEGLEGDSLSIKVYAFNNRREPVQELVVPMKDGAFEVAFEDTTIRNLVLGVPGDPRFVEGFERILYVPGENMVLSGTVDSVVCSGSQYYKDKQAFDDCCKAERAQVASLTNDYRAAMAKNQEDPSIEKIVDKIDSVQACIVDKTYEFAKARPSNVFTASIVGSLIGDDGSKALEVLDLLSDDVKEGYMKPMLEQVRTSAERAKAISEAAEKVKDGMPAPDFTLKNPAGEDFTLSSIFNQKKYIILDFWGTWCYWCVKGIPDMKKLYSDAKGRIEIVGIDCGESEEKWKDGIEKHQLPWLHVYNPGGDNDLSVKYAIKGYPTKIILNPDGTINRTVIGEDPEFYTYVRELIKTAPAPPIDIPFVS